MNISTLNIYFNLNTDSTRNQRQATVTPPVSLSSAVSNLFNSILRRNENGQQTSGEEMNLIVGFEPISRNELNNGIEFEAINLNTELFLYSPIDGNDTTRIECSICHISIINNEICRKINTCNHIFHQNCIDTWFNRHNTCPICRTIIS
jgi:hypothetical protein